MKTLITTLAISCFMLTTSLVAGDKNSHANKDMSIRASKIMGMEVHNMQDESLGTVNDIVVDVESGKIEYLAIAHGGVLGVGDKLFAVPMSALACQYDTENETHTLILDVSSKKFENAPGFNQDQWPDTANDKEWKKAVNDFYVKTNKKIPVDK